MARKQRSALVGIVTLVAVLSPAAAAQAATSASTTVTFTVSVGTLDITAPATVDLGTAVPGATVSGSIGPVTVTDTRGDVAAVWTATVSSTPFVNGASTIPNTAVTYWSGPTTASTPATGFTPGQPTAGDAVALGATVTAFSFSGSGGNTATWNPTLAVAVPSTAIVGVYTGTVTHSVS
jgi:hypothetical protein